MFIGCSIQSESFGIRNSLILTNPTFELRADPQYVSLDLTEDKNKIIIEGVYPHLTSGMLVAITDNTSVISGNLVDSDLNPLEGYIIHIFKTQDKGELTVDSIYGIEPSIDLDCKITSADDASFLFENLYSDNYTLSVYLSPQIYWKNFIKKLIQTTITTTTDSNAHSEFNNIVIKNNFLSTVMDIIKNTFGSSISVNKERCSKENVNQAIISAIYILKFLTSFIVDEIGKQKKGPYFFESKFVIALNIILNDFESLKDTFNLLDITSILSSKAKYDNIQISASEKPLRDQFLKIDADVEKIKNDIQNLLLLLATTTSNSKFSQSGLFLSRICQQMLFIINILKEASSIVIRSLNTLPQSADRNECFIGSTHVINLQSNSNVKITLTLDKDNRLTYVQSIQKLAKVELAKIQGNSTLQMAIQLLI